MYPGSQTKNKSVDESELAKFVSEAAILIEDELESIAMGRAWELFNGYGLDEDDGDTEVTLVKHIDTEEGWKIGHLSWNSLDSRVIASLVEDHQVNIQSWLLKGVFRKRNDEQKHWDERPVSLSRLIVVKFFKKCYLLFRCCYLCIVVVIYV